MAKEYIKVENIDPHYSTKLWRACHDYLSTTFGPTMFEDICKDAGVTKEYLLSDDNWVSNHFAGNFNEKLIEYTGDRNIQSKIGEFTLNPKSINHLEFILVKSLPTFLFFLTVPIQSKKLNRFHDFKILKFLPGHFRFLIKSRLPNEKVFTGFIENTIGVWRGLKNVKELKSLECTFQEVDQNDFIVDVRYRHNYTITGLLKNLLVLAGLVFPAFLKPELLGPEIYYFLFYFGIFGALAIWKLTALVGHNLYYHNINRKKTDELFAKSIQLDRRYQESNLLRELSFRLVGENNPQKIFKLTLDDLGHRFKFEKSLVMTKNNEDTHLETVHVRGFSSAETLIKLKLRYPAEKSSPQIFANILDGGKTVLIEMSSFVKTINQESKKLIDDLGVSSLIVSPIIGKESKFGILVIGSTVSERQLNKEDIYLIENITKMLALFFESAKYNQNEMALRQIFQKYVPPVVLESLGLLNESSSGQLKPKSTFVTSMFVDLRGFTSASERLKPVQVVDMLNTYTDYVTQFVSQMGGIIDNIVGDGLVIFFPTNSMFGTHHAKNALISAIHILGNIAALHERFSQKGLGKLGLGIGLHCGPVTVGSVGCDRKLNYTAIGDTVNLASRIQSMGKDFANRTESAKEGCIIFSSDVLNRASIDFSPIDLGPHPIRGREQQVQLFLIDTSMATRLAEALSIA